ncbi:MAG: hypothetical protein HQM04_08970 [Magnetococcales bacterium]|nr:hypothetical protein [Magnetococcales bacterium]
MAMLSISSPELIYYYHQAGKQARRQVVEPSSGVSSETSNRATQAVRRKVDGEGTDFSSVFAKALNRNS